MMKPLQNKVILLGVTGCSSAYKAAELASKLTQCGSAVHPILTQSSTQFISPLTFQTITGNKVYTDADLWNYEGHDSYTGLARMANLMIIAPASTKTIANLAHGITDNMLCLTAMAFSSPLILCPVSDTASYFNAIIQANIQSLRDKGIIFFDPVDTHPGSGFLNMLEPEQILRQLRYTLSQGGPLNGCKIVVTAGGTAEPLDPVRVITNLSTGKQGYAVAQAALDAGAEVTLISTVNYLSVPTGAHFLQVQTAAEMADAVMAEIHQTDALIMAAAVSDFRPSQVHGKKIRKEAGVPHIELIPTIDILNTVSNYRLSKGYPQFVVGFAEETENLLDNAHAKLEAKKLDLIVASEVRRTTTDFDREMNQVTMISADGQVETHEPLLKSQIAEAIIQKVIQWL